MQQTTCKNFLSRVLALTLLILAGVGCVRRGGALVVAVGGSWGGCGVGAPVMGMFWTEMPCGVMWWI